MRAARRIEEKDAGAFFGDLARAYLRRLRREDVAYFGEKTPAHSGYLPQIRRMFPEARFLWIYRDGRDVALSMQKVSWMNHDLDLNFLVWLFYFHRQLRAAADKTLVVHFIKYEDLVAAPVKELSRISEFLGLPFEPQVALGFGNREGVLEWETPWKERALMPITTERVGIWRSELSAKEVEVLEWLGGAALSRLGYQLTTPLQRKARVLQYPRLLFSVARFLWRRPFDETANQLFGRPICLNWQ